MLQIRQNSRSAPLVSHPGPAPPPLVWNDDGDIEPGVAHTSRWTAAMRAMENEGPNPLIQDPLARAFAGDCACEKWKMEMALLHAREPKAKSHIAIRARALDDLVMEEIEGMLGSAKIQIVSLGAGMCTRPWRLESTETDLVWFEVDRPDSVRLKVATAEKQPKPSGNYSAIGLDFSDAGASLSASLLERGFDVNAPTIFVMEGLLYYLWLRDIECLADEIRELVKGKARLVMSVINDGFYEEIKSPNAQTVQKYPGQAELGELFHSSWEGGIQEAFEGAGWLLSSVISREEYAEKHLGVQMMNYEFPDRQTSTEYIIVMQCYPNDGVINYLLGAMGLEVSC